MSGRGRFIAFEGGEGTGKSTQAARLARRLSAVLTHEPGDSEVGRAIRRIVLDPASGPLDDRTEALLMAADRAQHVAQIVGPALAAGRHVVTDRFAASSIAYQGYGRGLPVAEIEHLSRWATGGVWPDLVVLLDLPVTEAVARLGAARDRLEAAGDDFHTRVRDGFLTLATDDPERWVVIDGTGAPDDVTETIWEAVISRWPELAGPER